MSYGTIHSDQKEKLYFLKSTSLKHTIAFLTRSCITEVHYSVLINGSPTNEKVMKKGLRQGDPISPFLFILVTEILSKLLSNELRIGALKGIPFGPHETINHTQYADDTIIFAHPSLEELQRIKEVFLIGQFPFDYLGVPIGVNGQKSNIWDPVVLKVKKKLNGWKGQCLSHLQVGKTTQEFFWGGNYSKRKLALVKWSDVCKPKANGGFGVIPLRIKNLALLAKWWAHLHSNKTALWKVIVFNSFGSSFYGNLEERISNTNLSQLSPIWRDLTRLKRSDDMCEILGNNVWRWKLGNGLRISFWHDIWLRNLPLRLQFPAVFRKSFQKTGSVSDFYQINSPEDGDRSWNLSVIRPLEQNDSIEVDSLIKLLQSVSFNSSLTDNLEWTPAPNGIYSVSDGVRVPIRDETLLFPCGQNTYGTTISPQRLQYFIGLYYKELFL
ncbi:uncharacterized protein [Rutidosis leptorrhynchoides]|uniref:uncharacterized protein n=1 Tax=Rutidosis leptorrhynchoides TaxID=125765 RepID=UPI003A9A10A3